MAIFIFIIFLIILLAVRVNTFLYFKNQLFALKYTLKNIHLLKQLALLHVSVLSDHPQGVVVPSC